jgi:GrpB-like predicted nucleotidyltransferase (UPF0157 family)
VWKRVDAHRPTGNGKAFVIGAEKDRVETHMFETDNTDNTTGDSPNGASRAPSEQAGTTTRESSTEKQIQAAHIGEVTPLVGHIYIAEYDPAWPRLFQREAERILAALGERVVLLEHVGSTSVPGLADKPRIDVLLVVPDSADESTYVPALEAVSYVLRIREPDWYEHCVFKGPDTDVNLHVFSPGCPEIDRMLLFRDWLRSNVSDRRLYERTKRELARRDWKYTQNYADAKTAVVEEILARARGEGEEGGRELS